MPLTYVLENCLKYEILDGEHGNVHAFVSRDILLLVSKNSNKSIFGDLGNYFSNCAHIICVRELIFYHFYKLVSSIYIPKDSLQARS